MKYLLDTCVISDFIKGHDKVLTRLKSEQPRDLAISSVTKMEIEYGLALNPNRAKKIAPIIQLLLNNLTVMPFESESKTTANIRAQLKQQGRPIGAYDVMIAGCAKQHQLIMVTSNTKEFKRVDCLVLEDWRL